MNQNISNTTPSLESKAADGNCFTGEMQIKVKDQITHPGAVQKNFIAGCQSVGCK